MFDSCRAQDLQGGTPCGVPPPGSPSLSTGSTACSLRGLGLSLGGFGISVKLHTDPRVDPLPALHALLDLPNRLDERGGYRALIALDEFQDVAKIPSLDALLRSHIQFQGE